jgi:replicative DNA helicase
MTQLKPTTKPNKWSNKRQGYLDSLHYLQGRMRGEIKSFKTPWAKVNDATTDGFEWHSVTVIGGRPASGKTLIKDQLIREGFKLNAGEDFRVLEFQLEMLARTSAIREYSSVLGKTYKYLCSADGKISDADLRACHDYAKEAVKYPIDVVEDPCTVREMKDTIHAYMLAHSTLEMVRETTKDDEGKLHEKDVQKRIYKKTIVSLDHSLLLKTDKIHGEKDRNDKLFALGEAVTELKRKYPIHFIILSQLNRDIDKPERNEDGKYGNYVLESDIFGADALLQHADTLIGINRPGKQKIKFYGPDRYIIDDDTVMVMHFLKCRNGDTRMSFFKAEFAKMRITEMQTPGQQEKRLKI